MKAAPSHGPGFVYLSGTRRPVVATALHARPAARPGTAGTVAGLPFPTQHSLHLLESPQTHPSEFRVAGRGAPRAAQVHSRVPQRPGCQPSAALILRGESTLLPRRKMAVLN